MSNRLGRTKRVEEIRQACLNSLYTYACTVEPHRVWGDVHKEVFNWWQKHLEDPEGKDNLLCLLPRDHQKSHMMALMATWLIARDPAITILYVSATATLAEKQLTDIKRILESKVFSLLWPEMLSKEEGKREIWNNTEICVDHPLRKEEGVRDSTVLSAGLTKNVTGLHCKVLMKDDVVVPDNAYTLEARNKVRSACSQLASVLTTGGIEFVVGTRYHPTDHYDDLRKMKEEIHDDEGEIIDSTEVYDIFERAVEENGAFLWPTEFRASDGKPFGFNWKELARKKAKYLDTTQFFAQYYNNPNDLENQRIGRDKFLYYDRNNLRESGGVWWMNNRRLNVYAGMDFAYSTSRRADYSCIVVIGVDSDYNIYVLDIDRFKTKSMDVYFNSMLNSHSKWGFRALRAEVSVAQATIVDYLKEQAKREGMVIRIDEHRPNKYQGAKAERIAASLEPRYHNGQMFHFKGGYCSMLEEELMLENPAHDDIKDTLAIVVSGDIRKPIKRLSEGEVGETHVQYHPRFGGVMR